MVVSASSRVILLLALALACGPLGAADQPPAAAPAQAQATPPATLELGQRVITTFRATVGGRSPQDRVEGAKRRALEAYKRNPNPRLAVRVAPEGASVTADGAPIFAVVAGDVDALSGEKPETEARAALEKIELILEERRERTDPRALLTGGGLALAATLVLVLLVRALIALDRWAGMRLARAVSRKVRDVRLVGVSVLDPGHFFTIAFRVVHAIVWTLGFLLAFIWLNGVLEAFPHTRPWGDRLTQALVDTLATVGTAILDSLPGLMFVVVIVVLARFATRVGGAFFQRVREQDLKMGWLDRDTAQPARMIFSALVWLFALAMAYPYIPGAQSQAFQGLSVLVGLMVSIGASGTVSQGASGLILMFTRAFRVGDFVRVNDVEGTVVELGLFATRVRTGMGVEVMLPNTMVLGNSAHNYSRVVPGAGFVLDTVATIGYDTPWRQVEAMLLEAARRVEAITQEHPPRIFQTGLSDFYVEYRLVAYSKAASPLPRAEAINRLHAAIQDVFNEYGVQIMSPHYLGDPAEAKIVPKSKWFQAPAEGPRKP
jgi:small-conductance mechanosensitive channel